MSKIDQEAYLKAKKLIESVNEQLASELQVIVNQLSNLLNFSDIPFDEIDLVTLLSHPNVVETFTDVLERLKNPLLELHIKQIAKEYENI